MLRELAIPLCLAVAACSMVPYETSSAPTVNDPVVSSAVRAVFSESKLPGTPQISQIKAAHPVSRGDWVVCLRSSDLAGRGRYALYFTGSKLVHSQLAVQVDACDDEMYAPLTGDRAASR